MNYRNFVFVALLLIAAGCAAPAKKEQPLVFYPEPPAAPYIQYLVSFTSLQDIEAEKSAFDQFIIGKEMQVRLDKPYGVAIYDGKIYVCDTNRGLMVFDLKNRTFGQMKGAQGQGKLIQPVNISVDAEGNKYVSDPVRNQVVVYDKDDLYLRAYVYTGSWKPTDAVAYEDRVYVADMINSAIRVFDKKSGNFVKSFGDITGKPEERLGLPQNLVFDKDGSLYVTDAKRFQILKFDRDGHYLDVLGKLGTNLGEFARPRGIATDRENRLYVVDASFNVVQIFNKDKYPLLFFGGMGAGPGNLVLPAKVVVDYDNLKYFEKYIDRNFEAEYLLLVTSQFGEQMVNVYAYGKEKGRKYPTDEEALAEVTKKQKSLATKNAPAEKQENPAEKQENPAEKQENPAEKQENPAEKQEK